MVYGYAIEMDAGQTFPLRLQPPLSRQSSPIQPR